MLNVELDTHTLAIYPPLARKDADSESTIEFCRRSTPFTSFFAQLLNGHLVAAAVAFAAVLAEALTITLSGVPFNPGQIPLELHVCSFTSIAILAVMVVVLIMLAIWRWRSPYLPRRPNTIAALISYICASKFVDDMEEKTGPKRSEKNANTQAVECTGSVLRQRYAYGRMNGVDGAERWMVDSVS